jgi:hypothetical protein
VGPSVPSADSSVGSISARRIEGDGCKCDDPGLKGALIGAPIGAIAGGIVGAKWF